MKKIYYTVEELIEISESKSKKELINLAFDSGNNVSKAEFTNLFMQILKDETIPEIHRNNILNKLRDSNIDFIMKLVN